MRRVGGPGADHGGPDGLRYGRVDLGEFRQRAEAIQQCRRLAVGRMRRPWPGPNRIVGVTLARSTREGENGVRLEDVATGTAVRQYRQLPDLRPARVVVGLARPVSPPARGPGPTRPTGPSMSCGTVAGGPPAAGRPVATDFKCSTWPSWWRRWASSRSAW